jgi:hypothetical protein
VLQPAQTLVNTRVFASRGGKADKKIKLKEGYDSSFELSGLKTLSDRYCS